MTAMTVYRVYVSRETSFVKQQANPLQEMFHVKHTLVFRLMSARSMFETC